MTTQENTMLLMEISEKLDKIINIMQGKKNSEPLITFSKANKNADDTFIQERQKEIFQELDEKRWLNVNWLYWK